MRKQLFIKQIKPFLWRECHSCGEGIRFEKTWKLKIGVIGFCKNIYLCQECCKNSQDAADQRKEYHKQLR